jgi:hypothetical protein
MVFTEQVLGTRPVEKDILKKYLAEKRPEGLDKDELETLPDIETELQEGSTLFAQEPDGTRFIYDYCFKGLFKEACGVLRRITVTESHGLTSYKQQIGGMAFVYPRHVRLVLPEGYEPPSLEEGEKEAEDTKAIRVPYLVRPIRCETPQGPRVAIGRSEALPTGSSCEILVRLLDGEWEDMLREWLSFGGIHGMCQWRSGGYGSFTHEITQII